MPVSDIESITPILREVQQLQPKTVLDLGVGVGKYGVLCREVLDGVYGRMNRFEWKAQIIGVEGFKKYSNPAWGMYNTVVMQKFDELKPDFFKGYDLVLMIDALEHLEPLEGRCLLRGLIEGNKHLIVSVPIGEHPQGAVFGNELECHRTTFTDLTAFQPYRYRILHKGVCAVLSIAGGK